MGWPDALALIALCVCGAWALVTAIKHSDE